jgi:hypothetical protein
LVFNRKDEHFNDFDYQQETHANLRIVNSETNLDSASKSIKSFKFKNFFWKNKD